MRKVEVEVYTFKELGSDAKKRVITDIQKDLPEDGWADLTISDWVAKLDALGYPEAKIAFSGFYSQGDGASFSTGTAVDLKLIGERVPRVKKITDVVLRGIEDYGIRIKQGGHYSHEMTMSVDLDCREEPTQTQCRVMDELEVLVLHDARDLARQIYGELEADYADSVSDERITELAEINEFEFAADGKVFK